MSNNSRFFYEDPNYGFPCRFPFEIGEKDDSATSKTSLANEVVSNYKEFISSRNQRATNQFDKSIRILSHNTTKKSIKENSIPSSILSTIPADTFQGDPIKIARYKVLKNLTRKGIPNDRRETLWAFLFNLPVRKGERCHNFSDDEFEEVKYPQCTGEPLKNSKLNENFPNNSSTLKTESKYLNIILKDIPRTFSHHPFMGSDEGRQELYFILKKFSIGSIVGYCQSINFLAAILLLVFNKEKAYYSLKLLIEERLPSDYFLNLEGVIVDGYVIFILLEKYCKKIAIKLTKFGIKQKIPSLLTHWLLSMFCLVLPIDAVLRVWDMFLIEGEKILFRAAVSLFILNKKDILKCDNEGAIIKCIMNAGHKVTDTDKFVNIMFRQLKFFSRDKILKYRRYAYENYYKK